MSDRWPEPDTFGKSGKYYQGMTVEGAPRHEPVRDKNKICTRAHKDLLLKHIEQSPYTKQEIADILNIVKSTLRDNLNGSKPWPKRRLKRFCDLVLLDYYQFVT